MLLTLPVILGLAANSSAFAQELEVSKRDCERLNKRNASISADYQPGVDSRGNKVADADLNNDSQIKFPDEITIPIGIDIAEKYGLDAKGVSATASIGTVKIKGNKVYYDGKRLDTSTEDQIRRACQKAYAPWTE